MVSCSNLLIGGTRSDTQWEMSVEKIEAGYRQTVGVVVFQGGVRYTRINPEFELFQM